MDMEPNRPTMTLRDWGLTLAELLFGAFIGLIVATMAVMVLFSGLWIMLLLALPFILFQLLFNRISDAFIDGWKR